MRTATRLVVATVAGGLLAGCSVGLDLEPTTAPTSPEVVAPEAEGADGAGEDGAAEAASDAVAAETAVTEGIAPGTPVPVADVVARLAVEQLPAVAPATGTVVTSGAVWLTVPSDHVRAGDFDGVQLFEGPTIRGGRTARAGVQVYPPVTDATWAQRLAESSTWDLEGVTSTVYALDVPGADAAVVHVLTDTAGHAGTDREGRRIWQAPVTTALVLIGVGDEVTRVVLQSAPTPEGLDAALSVARTVRVALPG